MPRWIHSRLRRAELYRKKSNYLLSPELWILERCLIKKKIFKTAPLNSAHEENEQVTGTDNRFCSESEIEI